MVKIVKKNCVKCESEDPDDAFLGENGGGNAAERIRTHHYPRPKNKLTHFSLNKSKYSPRLEK